MKLGQITFKTWFGLAIFCLTSFCAGYFLVSSIEPNLPDTEVVELPPVQKANIEDLYPYSIKPQSTLFTTLRAHGVTPQEIQSIVLVSQPYYDLTRIIPGTRFNVIEAVSTIKQVSQIKFRMSSSEVLLLTKNQETWTAQKLIEQIDTKIVTFSGVVSSSLWKSAENAQMDPNLISELSEIFGWQVDFSREVQEGDQWRLSVEQKLIRGEPIGWGSILAAEYKKQDQTYTAILFKVDGEKAGYFAPDGSSLKRMFLKSPIKFGRITSRFSKSRFHPILQIRRPHLGVDYAAPTGTPIRAVGDGIVTFAGWQGGGGKVIKLRHNSTYATAYKHLSGYAKSIRSGARVRQGEIIGYVGNTGLSTAPHLHFEFFQNDRFVDPMGKKFPSADPVPETLMGEFRNQLPMMLSSLPDWKKMDWKTSSQSADQISN